MTRREEILTIMLERLTELSDPQRSGNGGGDTGLRLMPHDGSCRIDKVAPPRCTCSYRGVTELWRLLEVMKVERPKQYRHVRFRYIERTQALKDVPVKRKSKHGKTVTVVERRLVDQYPSWVRAQTVSKGVEWLAASWALPHEPFLPEELRVAA